MIESNPNPTTAPAAPAETPVQPVPAPESIRVWVCPQCRSWTGSSTLPDLRALQNTRSSMRNLANEDPSEWGKTTGSRATCQACRQQGRGDVERVPVEYTRTDLITNALKHHAEAAYKQEEKDSGVRLKQRGYVRPDPDPNP